MLQRQLRVAGVALVLLVGLLTGGLAQQHRVSHDFLLTNVRVFDGTQTLQKTQVAVTGGMIRAVGADVAASPTLPVVDGTGSTLVPGLIDAHVHIFDAAELRQALRFGITTVLDMGASQASPPESRAMRTAAGVASDMSDLRFAGSVATSPGGHGNESKGASAPTISTSADAKPFVAARRAEGSDYLKIMLNGVRTATLGMPNLDETRVRALVEAAHAMNLLAVAHVETLDDVTIALSARIDGIVHVWRRGGAHADVVRRTAERGIFVIPVLAIQDGFLPDGRPSLLADPRFLHVLSNPIREQLGRTFSATTVPREQLRTVQDAQLAAVRSLHAAGVRLLAGTDASRRNPTAHGISLHRELELLGQAGLSPAEILAAATSRSADAFRLADRGRIVPGLRADMLLVRGDPTTDLLAIRDIVRIWKAGIEVDRTVVDR